MLRHGSWLGLQGRGRVHSATVMGATAVLEGCQAVCKALSAPSSTLRPPARAAPPKGGNQAAVRTQELGNHHFQSFAPRPSPGTRVTLYGRGIKASQFPRGWTQAPVGILE